MARVIGGIGTSHVPTIGLAYATRLGAGILRDAAVFCAAGRVHRPGGAYWLLCRSLDVTRESDAVRSSEGELRS